MQKRQQSELEQMHDNFNFLMTPDQYSPDSTQGKRLL